MGFVAVMLNWILVNYTPIDSRIACLLGVFAGAAVYVFRLFNAKLISIEELEDMEDVASSRLVRLLIKIYDKFASDK